ncbi:uncharacterized protein LOC113335453 [Papaver somniferum]|uniref:uncharacterized protein LOC113335453 n=1 Tax=Papaver somniferum TaxID=3469 RepID=UPI000E6FC409|nr:uncharacterized protein LOC113335453 [Papaver somniferum]
MVHGQEPVISVTENALCLVPSLELQQRPDKNKAKSEPSAIFSKSVLVPSNSSVNSKGEVAQKPETHVVQEPKSTIGVSVHRDSSLNSQRKISQSVNGKAQLFPLGTETSGASLTGSMIGSASLSESREIQKQKQDQVGKRVKMSSNELLNLQVPLTYDGLNRLSATQLYKIRLSLRLRGCTGKGKKKLSFIKYWRLRE